VASDVARAAGKSSAADLNPEIVASNAAVIDQSLDSIRSTLAPSSLRRTSATSMRSERRCV
jgi:hypothetical protein